MVVGKRHRMNVLRIRLDVHHNLLWRGYSGQQQYVCVLSYFRKRHFPVSEESFQSAVLYRREEQLLIRIKPHSPLQYAVFHRFEVLGTLCHYYDVGSRLARLRLSQASGRQQSVVYYQPVIVHEQYAYACFYISVLVGVVEQNHLSVLCLPV